MKGILLAGGSGTRLYPSTKAISKQLLPVYDKPTIYYPLSVLMLGGITEILVISSPRDLESIEDLLGNGSQWGLKISYLPQAKPEGIAQAFIIAESFIGSDDCCLILGDNIFHGAEIPQILTESFEAHSTATIFAYQVNDPQRYGVVTFDKLMNPKFIEEKPLNPKSSWAVTGLYIYNSDVVKIAKGLKPSKRGELEISDINQAYLDAGKLNVRCMGRGITWLDTGTHESLLSASLYVQTIEQRQGLKIACVEEVAFRKGFITRAQLVNLVEKYPDCSYGRYLKQVVLDGNIL